MGVLVAAPLTVVGIVVVRELWVRDRLKKDPELE